MDYKEQTISGKEWQRCVRVVIENPYGGKPSINFIEEKPLSLYKLTTLNTAPASASATGTQGEIRITADAVYICTATNTWKKVAIATW